MKTFERMEPRTFLPFMQSHLAVSYPQHGYILGKEGLLNVIKASFELGAKYGLETRYEYLIFGEACLMLGMGFDSDPQLPWAIEILSKALPATERMDRLDDATTLYLEKTIGDENDFPRAAFIAWADRPYDQIEAEYQTFSTSEFEAYLANLWPEKFKLLTPGSIEQLNTRLLETAKQYSVSSNEGLRYLTTLQFLLGQSFASDPQFFWLSLIMLNPEYTDEDYMLTSLHFTVKQLFEAYETAALLEPIDL